MACKAGKPDGNMVWHPNFNAATTYSCNRTNGFTTDQTFNTTSKSFTK